MARMPDNSLVRLGPWPRGGNNVAREDSVPSGSFRQGVNVDVYPDGKVRRRPGMTLVNNTPLSNLWSTGTYSLATTDGGATLCRVSAAAPPVPLYTGLVPGADIAYCEVNTWVYVSDGVTALRVDQLTNAVRPWSLPTPAAPSVSLPPLSITPDAWPAGGYQVAVTYLSADGDESAAALAVPITLSVQGAILVDMPAPPAGVSVAATNVYMTKPGGTVFYLHDTYPAAPLHMQLRYQDLGRELRTLNLSPMPPGSAAVMAGGRLLVASSNCVFWSSFGFGLTDFAKCFWMYPAAVDMLAAAAPSAAVDGVFVAAGARTYFSAGGDPTAAVSKLVLACGAIRGAPVYVNGAAMDPNLQLPPTMLPVWVTTDGFVALGLPDGTARVLTLDRYAMRTGERASLAHRTLAGVDQIVVGVRNPGPASVAVSSDSADAVLVRNGVVL